MEGRRWCVLWKGNKMGYGFLFNSPKSTLETCDHFSSPISQLSSFDRLREPDKPLLIVRSLKTTAGRPCFCTSRDCSLLSLCFLFYIDAILDHMYLCAHEKVERAEEMYLSLLDDSMIYFLSIHITSTKYSQRLGCQWNGCTTLTNISMSIPIC